MALGTKFVNRQVPDPTLALPLHSFGPGLQSVFQLAILGGEGAARVMKTLFVIAALSFAALVGAALAILRHIRSNSTRAAADPTSDAQVSEAIGLRLSEIARQPSELRTATPIRRAEQDFTFFNREADSGKTLYPEAPPPTEPAIADRH